MDSFHFGYFLFILENIAEEFSELYNAVTYAATLTAITDQEYSVMNEVVVEILRSP